MLVGHRHALCAPVMEQLCYFMLEVKFVVSGPANGLQCVFLLLGALVFSFLGSFGDDHPQLVPFLHRHPVPR